MIASPAATIQFLIFSKLPSHGAICRTNISRDEPGFQGFRKALIFVKSAQETLPAPGKRQIDFEAPPSTRSMVPVT